MSSLEPLLNSLSRKELFSTLVQMGGTASFDTSKENLIQQIIQKVDTNDKVLQKPQKEKKWNDLICNLILFIIALVCILIVFLLFLQFNIFPSKNSFCSSNSTCSHDTKNCIKCPSHANCSNGHAQCQDGFLLVHKYCITNDGDAIFLGNMIDKELHLLSRQAGLFTCRYSNDESLSRNDLLIQLIRNSKPKNVDIELLANKAVDHLEHEESIVITNINGINYYTSKEVDRPFSCKVRNSMYSHIKLYLTIALSILGISVISFKKQMNRFRKMKIKDCASIVIRKYSGSKERIRSSQIVADMSKVCNETNSFWNEVFYEVSKNKNCTVYPDEYKGYYVQFK